MWILAGPLRRAVQCSAYHASNSLRRSYTSSTKRTPNPKFDKISRLQEFYQQDNGKPIFLKGPRDNILYRATWAFAIAGLLYDLVFLFGYILA